MGSHFGTPFLTGFGGVWNLYEGSLMYWDHYWFRADQKVSKNVSFLGYPKKVNFYGFSLFPGYPRKSCFWTHFLTHVLFPLGFNSWWFWVKKCAKNGSFWPIFGPFLDHFWDTFWPKPGLCFMPYSLCFCSFLGSYFGPTFWAKSGPGICHFWGPGFMVLEDIMLVIW